MDEAALFNLLPSSQDFTPLRRTQNAELVFKMKIEWGLQGVTQPETQQRGLDAVESSRQKGGRAAPGCGGVLVDGGKIRTGLSDDARPPSTFERVRTREEIQE